MLGRSCSGRPQPAMSPIASSPELASARVGVIGGSGLYSINNLESVEEVSTDTPFGPPSDALRIGTLNGVEVVFLARHGRQHHLIPSEVPYRANIWAMRSLGVRWLISVSAVGSLREHLRPRDMVVPDSSSTARDNVLNHSSVTDALHTSAWLIRSAPFSVNGWRHLLRRKCPLATICIAVVPTCAWKALLFPPERKASSTAAGVAM